MKTVFWPFENSNHLFLWSDSNVAERFCVRLALGFDVKLVRDFLR